MTQMKIVPMEACHVAQVAALEPLCFADPWSENSVGSELHNPLSYWLVAQSQDEVLGYVGSQTVMDEADVMNLAVSPRVRGLGIGRKLLQALAQALKARGAVSLTLEVRPSNAPAVHLYRSEGFCEVGRRKNYYRNPTEDAFILRKELEL